MKTTLLASLASLAALGCAGAVHGASITVGNHSFEETVLSPGGWLDGQPPSWTSPAGQANNFIEYIVGFVSDGNNHYGMAQGVASYQELATAWLPNTDYQLVIGVGNRNASWTAVGNQSSIALESTADPVGTHLASTFLDSSTLPESTFADLTLTFTTGASAPAGNIRIWIGSTGDAGTGRGHFDNVRLDASPVPEPSFAALLGLSLALGARRRRR